MIEVSFTRLMELSRKWDSDHAELMRDHALFVKRLESTAREAGVANNAPARNQ